MRPSIVTLVFLAVFSAGLHAQTCSADSASNCRCPDTAFTDCMLLPDLTVSRQAILDSAGMEEYPQQGAGENYPNQGADDGRLRLALSKPNIGYGPFSLSGSGTYVCGTDTFPSYPGPCSNGNEPSELQYQKIYHKMNDTMVYYFRPAGSTTYHPFHLHVHVDNWAVWSLRMEDPDEPDPGKWPIVGENHKTGFCLYDFGSCSVFEGHCRDANDSVLYNGDFPNFGLGGYAYCSSDVQGISSGHVDIYEKWVQGMWIDIPPGTCNGDYYIVAEVDPLNLFLESDETNNRVAVPVTLTKQDAPGNPVIRVRAGKYTTICGSDSVELRATGGKDYLWSTGDTVQSIFVSVAGDYYVTVTNHCGTAVSDTVSVSTITPPPPPTVTGDTVCRKGQATLTASGTGLVRWYAFASGGGALATGSTFVTPPLMSSAVYYADNTSVTSGATLYAGKTVTTAGAYRNSREFLWFDCISPFTLATVDVYAADSSTLTIDLADRTGLKLETKLFLIVPGKNTLDLSFAVGTGTDYSLLATPNDSGLFADTAGATYPYAVSGVLHIKGSSAGSAVYPYFYNWKIITDNLPCAGSRVPVTAAVDTTCTVGLPDIRPDASGFEVFPNPAYGTFTIRLTGTAQPADVVITDISGRTVYVARTASGGKLEVDLRSLPAGSYIVKAVMGDNGWRARRIVLLK